MNILLVNPKNLSVFQTFGLVFPPLGLLFSIMTPYPGTPLFNTLKCRLRHKKWRMYDGVHLVFRHGKVSYVPMQLLLWAYISYYARGWKAIKGFIKAFMKNTPILRILYDKAG
ncbi:MAG: hypothetical protein ABFR82_15510 [Nitrospirota bacterium]